HPNDEHLTVIQGTFVIGMGRSASRETAKELPVGSFLLIPNRTDHYAWAKGETIVQLHGVGPGGLLYVNPADDPRNKSASCRDERRGRRLQDRREVVTEVRMLSLKLFGDRFL